MIDREELGAWLRLLEAPGLGRESARKLLAAFGSPQAILAAPAAALREVAGPSAVSALAAVSPTLDTLITTTLDWLTAETDVPRSVIAIGDSLFPATLLHAADPPLLLYTHGNTALLSRQGLAVVGSRNPTRQGTDNARALSATLSQAGLTIISGLALGIDAAAHEGGLEGDASTIAVVGTGLDRVYPKRHLALAHRIAKNGLIVSEYSLGTPPLPQHFPNRNRIIAGLARGTLVVEAALKSGSLITARLASESGRDVFAIPGSIHSPQSRGCHALIKQGAKLVETAQDILEEFQLAVASAASPQAALIPDADPVLAALGFDPVTLDALVARTDWSAAALSVRLLELELSGRIARLPGQLFQRIGTA